MNQRIIIFFSMVIIVVGVVGISLSGKSPDKKNPSPVVEQTHQKKKILVAEALRNIESETILRPADYQLKYIEIDNGSEDGRDLKNIKASDVRGFLSRARFTKDSFILPAKLESPDSKTFYLHSLGKDELPYGYLVNSQDSYLLTTISVGNKVSLYLRFIEVDKSKQNATRLVSEMGSSAGSATPNYVIQKIAGPLDVLQVKQFEKQSKENSINSNKKMGMIIVRMNKEQMAAIKLVEKVGDLILFPAEGQALAGNKRELDTLLPQFHSVKQLRGGRSQ